MTVTLRAYADPDLELTLALETDPVAMAELGGPRSRETLVRAQERRLREPSAFVIEADGEAVGSIGAWATEHDDGAIQETGWMVLPAHHRRGIARAGLGLLLDRLRAGGAVEQLHAFPGVGNVASNRLCDRFGFADLGEVEVDFAEHLLQTRHRVLDLGRSPPGPSLSGSSQ